MFIPILLSFLIAGTRADYPANSNSPMNQIHSPAQPIVSEQPIQFASERQGDTYGAPSAPIVDKYPSSPQVVWEEPYYAQRNPVFYDGNTSDVGFGQGFLGTAIQVVLGLFAFSLLISLVTKVAGASFFADIFEGRSLDPDSLAIYTEMALNGIEKAKKMYANIDKN